MNPSDLFELSRELHRKKQPHAWVTVVAVQSPSSAYVGAQAIVEADGVMHGWIGGGCVQGAARSAALQALLSATPQRLRLSNTGDASEAIDVRPMTCASNGEVELFIQPAAVAPRLRIHGNTPVAKAAGWLAREADFDPVSDADEADAEAMAASFATQVTSEPPLPGIVRESYALIATQGDGDEEALETALRSPARAVLIVASRRKAERLRTAMALRGISEERINAIRAPAGPDIGAVTPNEIALAAVAGLVALRRNHGGGSGGAGGRADNQHGATGDDGDRDPPARPAQNQATKCAASGAALGSNATGYVNPVCGAVVDPARAVSSLTLSGQTHYFCCQGCRTEFERNPEKYLAIGAHMREPSPSLLK